MDVIDALATVGIAVHHDPVAVFIETVVPGQLRGGGHQFAQQRRLLGRNFIQGGVVRLGDDQHMGGCLGKEVVEGDDAIILEGDPGGNLLRGDLAEDAVHED